MKQLKTFSQFISESREEDDVLVGLGLGTRDLKIELEELHAQQPEVWGKPKEFNTSFAELLHIQLVASQLPNVPLFYWHNSVKLRLNEAWPLGQVVDLLIPTSEEPLKIMATYPNDRGDFDKDRVSVVWSYLGPIEITDIDSLLRVLDEFKTLKIDNVETVMLSKEWNQAVFKK